MAAAIPPRPEDVYGGGGSFSACLSRAIRHTSTTTQTQNANNNSSIATPTTDGVVDDIPPPQGNQLIDTSSTSASTANQDGTNNSNDQSTQEGASLTTPIKIPRAPSSIEYKTPQRRVPRWDKSNPTTSLTTNNTNNTNDGKGEQDWSQHHISYNKLRSTLYYFSKRRSLLRTKLRSNNNKVLTEEEFNISVTEFGSHAPFLNNNCGANDSDELKNYDRAGKYRVCIVL